MWGMKSLQHPEAAPGQAECDPTVGSCPFCNSDAVRCMEIDQGVWTVCCSWCGTMGPQSRSLQLAVARWNAPLERQAVPPAKF